MDQDLTSTKPPEMLELGIFGGYYFKGDTSEYPSDGLKMQKSAQQGFYASLNYFKVASGHPSHMVREGVDHPKIHWAGFNGIAVIFLEED
ncbi:MAG: hypothetical protein Ct9H300mP6_08130 [Gammaproteobacteria bacterium]|nr:MAG: hypothetical protein Ct9H300mP6_08130 [Gammaproteobacteria bacterium]